MSARRNTQGRRPAAPAVLLTEHDPAVAELARRYLTRAGCAVTAAPDATAAHAALRDPYDVLVLDAAMPGLDVAACLRALPAGAVVTVGDPRDGDGPRLARPYAPRQLVARVRAAAGGVAAGPPCAAGPLTVDPGDRSVRVHGAPVALTATEFTLLAYLMARPGRVHSRVHLLDALWPAGGRAGARTVDVHVAQIRAKLGAASPIRTIRGVGYVADPARNASWSGP